MQARREEADAFYATVIPSSLNEDETNVMRQALAGMLWSKQYYFYDVNRWLEEHGADPFRGTPGQAPRNMHWHHAYNADILSMPDKWEYPWFAAWDLAFHVLALTLVDEDFGKHQLDLLLESTYLHPNGQLPAYEWNFGDVNPPGPCVVHHLHLPARAGPSGAWRCGVARARLPEVVPQLHLVNQSQGPDGQQCVRRWLPGAGQHRSI